MRIIAIGIYFTIPFIDENPLTKSSRIKRTAMTICVIIIWLVLENCF